jgi:hypothetical protein
MPAVEAAVARYAARQPMNLDRRSPESVKMALSSSKRRRTCRWPANCGPRTPVIPYARSRSDAVLIGGKDVQVDVVADGRPLEGGRGG